MEQTMLWVTIFGIIIIPLIGWIFNTLITKKIDDLTYQQDKDRELFFKKYDILKEHLENSLSKMAKDIETEYVLQKLYDQAMQFHQKETDTKFNNLIETMNGSFKRVEGDIKEVKDLINAKFNAKKQGE